MVTGTRIGVLGPTTLVTDGAPVGLSPTQRRILATSVLAGPRGCTVEQLIHHVWGASPPRSARPSLHNQLARLRRSLPPGALAGKGGRYRLDADTITLDVDELQQLAARASTASRHGDPAEARRASRLALDLWRGDPYLDLTLDATGLAPERARLDELRQDVEDLHARALVDGGHLSTAISHLQRLTSEAPHREERWLQLMEALLHAGRRAEALGAYGEARRYLTEELGLDPPAPLEALQQRVLGAAPHTRQAPDDLVASIAGSSNVEVAGIGGRLLERAQLTATLDAELSTHRIVVLTGEAGLGKSTAAAALARRRRARGRSTVTITCAANPWSALQPIVDLLDQLDDRLDDLDPPPPEPVQRLRQLATTGGGSTPSPSPPSQDTQALARGVAATLARIADTTGGLTIVVDEAHRGGPTTHRLVLAAAEANPAIELLAVTRQESALPPSLRDAARCLPLPGLDRREVRKLVSWALPSATTAAATLIDWLEHQTGGNPLFVTALLADLHRRGDLRPADGARGDTVEAPRRVEVPVALRGAIEATIDALGIGTRRALDVAAVIDSPIDETTLAELVDPHELQPACEAGVLAAGPDGRLAFRHGLLRRVAYDLVPTGRRIELHLHVAQSWAARGLPSPQVASHALAAAELDPVGAHRSAVAAAEAALAAPAYEEAAQWFERAGEVAANLLGASATERLALRVEAADARRLAGLPGHADGLLDAAEEAVEVEDAALRQRAVLAALRLGETGEAGERQRRAADLARRALQIETDPRALARILASATLVHSMSGEPDRCRQLFAEALALLEDDDPATAIEVLPYAYLGLSRAEDLEAREAAAARLLRDADRLEDPIGAFEGWHLEASAALQRGDGPRVREAQRRAAALLDRVGDAGRTWSAAYLRAGVLQLDGRLEEAESAAEEALRIGSGVAAERALSAYAGQLLELRRLQGRLDELAPLVTQLVDQQTALPAWRAAASLVLAGTDPDRSAALFDELAADGFAAVPRDFTWLASLLSLARGAVARGSVDDSARIEPLLAPYADRVSWQGTCTYGPVATVLAELARLHDDQPRAAELAVTAVTLAERLEAPSYRAEAEALLPDDQGSRPLQP